jgi:hypothetical protein
MPVLHVPTLRESAYNTPAETPNNKSLRRLQKLRTTSRITEESYRHFWHVNQGEAEAGDGAGVAATAAMRGAVVRPFVIAIGGGEDVRAVLAQADENGSGDINPV